MFRFIKELYYTCFTLFYRLASDRWSRPSNIGKGIAGVTALLGLIVVVIAGWVDVYLGKRFFLSRSNGVYVAGYIVLGIFNCYVLLVRGHGIKFEQDFSHLEKKRKRILLVSWTVLVVAFIAFFIYSVQAYQHFFHIVPKSGM
jgi:hypothetical protein